MTIKNITLKFYAYEILWTIYNGLTQQTWLKCLGNRNSLPWESLTRSGLSCSLEGCCCKGRNCCYDSWVQKMTLFNGINLKHTLLPVRSGEVSRNNGREAIPQIAWPWPIQNFIDDKQHLELYPETYREEGNLQSNDVIINEHNRNAKTVHTTAYVSFIFPQQ